MSKPVFKNRENALLKVEMDGKITDIWVSRSVAVHGILIVRYNDIDCLLLTKRSENCPDEVGKYANVTGYLDWNESGIDALKREYWEEVNLYFDKYCTKDKLIYGDLDQPFSVKTDPSASKQNVTLRYGFIFELDELPELSKTKEVKEVNWIPVADVLTMIENDPTKFAWDHSDVIKNFIDSYI